MANNINARRRLDPVCVFTDDTKDPEAQQQKVFTNPWKSSIRILKPKSCSAFVDDLEMNLINHIATFGQNCIVVGCIAWLSNPRIIGAIRQHCSAALLLVNDENYATWGAGKCMALYKTLPHIKEPPNVLFDHLETPLAGIDKQEYLPVRCIRNTSDALMHSKYLVFFRKQAYERKGTVVWRDVPTAVWTGSMNYTVKASRNQENAVFIESEAIAAFYFNDFAISFLKSAPLRTTAGSGSGGGGGGAANDDRPVNLGFQAPPKLPHATLKKKRRTTAWAAAAKNRGGLGRI